MVWLGFSALGAEETKGATRAEFRGRTGPESKMSYDAVTHTHTHTHNRLTAFVRDYPGKPVPEETLTHSHPS